MPAQAGHPGNAIDWKALAVLSKSFVEMKTLAEEPDMRKLCTEAFLPPS